MTKKVIRFKGWWKQSDLQANPKHLFIFGDNDIERGKGGQAIIRDEPNAFGIPTKKLPSLRAGSFYTDEELEDNTRKIDNAIHKILHEFYTKEYDTLVFPEDGLGTGYAQLQARAPKTYQYLTRKMDCITQLFS